MSARVALTVVCEGGFRNQNLKCPFGSKFEWGEMSHCMERPFPMMMPTGWAAYMGGDLCPKCLAIESSAFVKEMAKSQEESK